MRPRMLSTIALAFALAAAACSGTSPTQGPGATTQPGGGGGGGTATTEPGGGGGGGGTGKVTYQVTGDVEKAGELPFFGFGSRFDRNDPAGVALNFTTEGGAIFSIGEVAGLHTVALVDEEHGLNWTSCETFDLNITGTDATGRFDCGTGMGTVVADGSIVSNIHITGTFDAHG